jgi:glycosyltransferase involved in cell wall biosynthesis
MSNNLNFLLFDGYRDILNNPTTHYSMDKGVNFGIGLFNNGCKVNFVTTGKTEFDKENKIKYINNKEITQEFLQSIDVFLIIREMTIEEIFKENDILFEILETKYLKKSEYKTIKIGVKSDSPGWIMNKVFRNLCREKYKDISKGWARKVFDFVCVQSESFKELGKEMMGSENKLIYSRMGVPNTNINFSLYPNPYKYDHSYCVNEKKSLTEDRAYFPNKYNENIEEFNKPGKKIIVYTGRIKNDSGKIIFNMRNIMQKLGNNYELHIFPGSFYIPAIYDSSNNLISERKDCSAKNGSHLLELQNLFTGLINVIVHYPYQHNDMFKYLIHADCGIDFSSSRPSDEISIAGHAKLLEYSYAGVPIVTEDNICNINVVKNTNNCFLLRANASDDDYVEAIKTITKFKNYEKRIKGHNITKENESWDNITNKFLKDIKKYFE